MRSAAGQASDRGGNAAETQRSSRVAAREPGREFHTGQKNGAVPRDRAVIELVLLETTCEASVDGRANLSLVSSRSSSLAPFATASPALFHALFHLGFDFERSRLLVGSQELPDL